VSAGSAGGRVYQQRPSPPPDSAPAGAGNARRRHVAPVRSPSDDDWGAIARIYDLEHPAARGAELRFWDQQARETGGPVLELAAGTGRIAIALARKGRQVTGLELSEGMLERARGRTARLAPEAQARLRWVQGDMAGFDLPGERFGLVFVAYNSFWLLPDLATQGRCLDCVRRHLAPAGRFVLDVFPPVADDYQDESGLAQWLPLPQKGRTLVRVKDYSFDAASQRGVSAVRYYAGRQGSDAPAKLVAEFRYALRLVPPGDVRRLLAAHGFEVEAEFGSYERGPLEESSPRAIYVCRPSPAR
jgi:SAM-dependent methyltransferase